MLLDLYEVNDLRKISEGAKLAPVALLENVPGAMHVWEVTGKSRTLELTDDNYEWKDGELTIYTPEGMVHFSPLRPDSAALAFVTSGMDDLVQDCLTSR